MVEESFYWDDGSVGDGSLSPYDNDEFSDLWRVLFLRDRTTQGVIESYENGLVVSNPSGNNIRVATGAALVDGKFYETDANVDNAIATPAVSTRIDRVVLRKSWAAQTVRVFIITGVEGAGVPAITQTDGVTWDVPLAQVSITTGAAITITSEIAFARTPLTEEFTGAMSEIETITADGSSATIDFQNIPDTFTHLFLIGQIRFAGAVTEVLIEARLNNDSGANYNEQDLKGDGASATASGNANQNEISLGRVPGASATANMAGQIQAHLANYVNTTFFKTLLAQFLHIRSNTPANWEVGLAGGMWKDTTAVSRITLLSTTGSSGNIASGSVVTLYGIS